MEKEAVDVLMTTFETNPQYLRKQIDSILNQTYSNIKLIISDDKSSTPETQQILKEYEKKDNRIRLYLQEHNVGYIKNFEFLLKQSTSKYISFSDHDDIWYPEKIEKSLKMLQEEKVDLVYCNCKQIDQNGDILHEDYFEYKNMPLVKGKNEILGISRYLGIGCSQIFTKEVKERMLPFTPNVMAHDWLASFIANEKKGVSYIKEPLFEYRLHTNNVFGGRSLSQNIARWKKKYGKTYKGYLKYRKEAVIEPAYLNGIKMCLEYCDNSKNKEIIEKITKYYERIEKSKYINFHFNSYYKYLDGKNIKKKKIREILIFHIPILGYIRYII